MIKRVHNQPESGQWVEIWEFENQVWSGVYRQNDGEIERYNHDKDQFEEEKPFPGCKINNTKYYIYEKSKFDMHPENTIETQSGGFSSARLVPGDDGVVLILFQPGQHRSIMPLSRSGAEAIVEVLSRALDQEVNND